MTTRPEFIRLPKPRTSCPHTGMSRTSMYNLCVPTRANGFKPKVPAKCLRVSGNVRGTWYVPYEALVSFLNALPTEGMKGGK